MDLAEKTVKNYVSNLLRKLNMRSRTEAAVFVTNLQVDRERCRQLADVPPPPPRPVSPDQVVRRPRRVALSLRASSSTSKCCR